MTRDLAGLRRKVEAVRRERLARFTAWLAGLDDDDFVSLAPPGLKEWAEGLSDEELLAHARGDRVPAPPGMREALDTFFDNIAARPDRPAL